MPRLLPTSMLTPPPGPPNWLVENLFYKGSMIVLAGDAGVGKSILGYTAAISIAAGLPLLGLQSTQERVLYFDEENSLPDAQEYFRWAWRGCDCPDIETLDSRLRFEHFTLSSSPSTWIDSMLQACREHSPGLIILDTATPACRISDENDNAEATRAIQLLRRAQIVSGPSTTFLILKHARLAHDAIGNEYRTIRGAKAWVGATDGCIFHVAQPGRPQADGLRKTHLRPSKTRAFGLRIPLTITPAWTSSDSGTRGLKLFGAFSVD